MHHILTIIFLFLFLSHNYIFNGVDASMAKSMSHDLSTPEKTIGAFVEAFQSGNDDLLGKVASGVALPEFNAIQKIECPTPELRGFEIHKTRKIDDRCQYAYNARDGDIELYVLLKWDESRKADEECQPQNLLWVEGTYLLRKFAGEWRIVDCVPFWPEKIIKMAEE